MTGAVVAKVFCWIVLSAQDGLAGVRNFSRLPYGPSFNAVLPGIGFSTTGQNITKDDESITNLWWLSLDRNNKISCSCGEFGQSNLTDGWVEENVKSLNTYSWAASLVATGQANAFCGASLVNDRYVLTAASCVDGSVAKEVEVLVGTWPFAHMNQTEGDELNVKLAVRRKVRRVIIHPNYTSDGLDYNIALLRLHGPVPDFGVQGGFSPVCLPSETDNFDGLNSSSLVWRFAQDDQVIFPVRRTEVESKIISKKECKGLRYVPAWDNMPDYMVCTKTEKPSNKSHPYFDTFDCPGDAGGPLLVTVNGRKVQVGVDMWTPCFGRPDGVGVFTRITELLPWIQRHISADGRHCAFGV